MANLDSAAVIFTNSAFKAGGVACKHVDFVVAVPDGGMHGIRWFAGATDLPDDAVGLRVHFTRTESTKGSENSLNVFQGRPVLADIVREAHASAGKVAIVACGPDGFLHDVRNAVAEAGHRRWVWSVHGFVSAHGITLVLSQAVRPASTFETVVSSTTSSFGDSWRLEVAFIHAATICALGDDRRHHPNGPRILQVSLCTMDEARWLVPPG
ncbi:hypothetical protein C8R43DRAFT_1136151 [Mycena crocata]|nr:hypothetical protein C8R43DRAFT_1136151 [Mycena crocata]